MQQRRQKITELINQEGQITFTRLKEAFPDVSEMTLRTDLKALDEKHAIIRIHGGARSIEIVTGTDGPLAQRSIRRQQEKIQIAKKATSLLHSCSSVFLDSGSTTATLARFFPDEPRQIFTSGLSCASELASLEKATVHMIGGQLNRYSLSVSGSRSVLELQDLHFDICFLGVTSFHPDIGFCCGGAEDRALKQMAIRRADLTVALMDSSKFGLSHAHCICKPEDVDILVTDDAMAEAHRAFFIQKGIRLL